MGRYKRTGFQAEALQVMPSLKEMYSDARKVRYAMKLSKIGAGHLSFMITLGQEMDELEGSPKWQYDYAVKSLAQHKAKCSGCMPSIDDIKGMVKR
jgi:hypothetical protein